MALSIEIWQKKKKRSACAFACTRRVGFTRRYALPAHSFAHGSSLFTPLAPPVSSRTSMSGRKRGVTVGVDASAAREMDRASIAGSLCWRRRISRECARYLIAFCTICFRIFFISYCVANGELLHPPAHEHLRIRTCPHRLRLSAPRRCSFAHSRAARIERVAASGGKQKRCRAWMKSRFHQCLLSGLERRAEHGDQP